MNTTGGEAGKRKDIPKTGAACKRLRCGMAYFTMSFRPFRA